MLKEIELRNIRVFDDKGIRLRLPTLSVICGTNNSGKSTILKSLLLLRQSQGFRESSGAIPGRLRFVGSQVDLGNYTSFVHSSDIQQDIVIGISVAGSMPANAAQFLHNLTNNEPPNAEKNEIVDDLPDVEYMVRARFTFTARAYTPHRIEASELMHEEVFLSGASLPQGILKKAEYEIIIDDQVLLSWWVEMVIDEEEDELSYDLYIPKKYFEDIGGLRYLKLEETKYDSILKATTLLEGLLPGPIVSIVNFDSEDDSSNKDDKEEFGVFPLPPHISSPIDALKNSMRHIHYLGPLRTAAKRFYITNSDITPGLDPSGEFLPYILRDRASSLVSNVRPKQNEVREEKLIVALNTWLYYLRVGDVPQENPVSEISISTTKDILVEFQVMTVDGSTAYALADSGVGYSQVLPILIRGLLAGKNCTVIVEQPELHLNPALQVRLAEFFVAMARAEKQMIIETHSEHIVNTIRVLTAEDEEGSIVDEIGIFFIDTSIGKPIIHELSLQPDGTVPEWPKHFFGEATSLAGRLLRAQKRFRKNILP